MKTLQFLLLEDVPLDAQVVQDALTAAGFNFDLVRVETRVAFVQALEFQAFDLILADYSLPMFDGISALKIAQHLCPETPFIFVSASLGEELAIETLKQGATDYVLKQRLGRLVPCVRRALREAEIQRARQQVEMALRQSEARLHAVAANLPNGAVFILDRDLRYQLAAGEALQEANFSPADLVGKTIWEALEPSLASYYEPYLRQALAGNSFKMEHCSHGRHYISHGTPLRNHQGEVDAILAMSYNITDRKHAEAELRESEARFRHMADSAPVLVWMAGTDKLCNYFNRQWLEFTGRPIEQEIGNGWVEGVHPEDVQRCVQTYTIAFEAREPFRMEYRLKRFDGTYRWILDAGVPRYTADAQFLGYIGSCIDIEEQKQTEAALRESEARFRLMVESAKEYAIFTLNAVGMITSWNSGAEQLLGYQEAEILGRSSHLIFTPEDNALGQAERELQIAATFGQAEDERWHLRKDGSRFWASGLVMPLQSEDKTKQGFIKIMQDKTRQRQADEHFQLLYDTTSDLLATEQPMTLMHNLFGKLSELLELDYYYNYMVEERDGKPGLHLKNYEGISEEVAQSIAWLEMGQYLCGWVAQERRQIVLDQAQIATHPNARLICAFGVTAYAGQPLITQGRLLGTLSFASHTRTRFTAEEIHLLQSTCDQMAIALERANLLNSIQQQAEQLQRANQIKDEFLAVLSHELRSPLNPILGWTRLLQTGRLDATRQSEALATIERNAKLQSQLIEDLLDLSRIMQGKLSLTAQPVDLTAVILDAFETVRLAAEAKAIDLQFTPSLSTAATVTPTTSHARISKLLVSGDAARLQQVVWNLLTNAIKFTPNGGRVEVRLEPKGGDRGAESSPPSPSPPHSAYAQITVTDTGKGIAPEFLPHVFEYFRQEDGSTTRRFGGLGLGLAIVRQIVEMHGGTVEANSPGEGQGATFTVKLPLQTGGAAFANGAAEDPLRTPSLQQPLAGVQVLVVDDDADTREFQAFLLEEHGAQVTMAASGMEALQMLEQTIPDVLVSDVGMAEMDGYMLIRMIRSRPANQGGAIPAIAVTAYARDFDQQKTLAAGFQAHISKPLDSEKLIQTIVDLLRQT